MPDTPLHSTTSEPNKEQVVEAELALESRAATAPARGDTVWNGAARGARRSRIRTGKKKPETPVEFLVERFRDYLYIPDPIAVYVFMGAVAGNLIPGSPVWLMLTSAPASGKTELLESVLGLPRVFEADSIKNESSFLSGTSKRERSKDATGGLLRQVGGHGALITADFTQVMSMHPENAKEILALLTKCYDGRWTRTVGAEGGKQLPWEGRLAYFGGVTGAKMDEYHAVTAALGQRWLFFRMEPRDGYMVLKQIFMNSGTGWKMELRDLVTAFFDGLDLGFGRMPEGVEPLKDREVLRISRIAAVAARCRSGVPRDWRSKDIIAAAETEFEGRIGQALGQLYLGMREIGVNEGERWRAICKVALDSMPKLRRMVLGAVVRGGGKGALMSEVMTAVAVPEAQTASRAAVDRAIVDLCIHGVLCKTKSAEGSEKGQSRVMLSEWMSSEYYKAFR